MSSLLSGDRFTPRYVQIRDHVVAQIESGELAPGERLAGEHELSAQYRVGRPTVRQALSLLRQEGWVATRRGAGTYVARGGTHVSLLGFDGLTEAARARGLELVDEVIATETVASPPLVDLDPTDTVGDWFCVTRVRSLRERRSVTPLCVEVDCFPLTLCPNAEAVFTETGSATAVVAAPGGLTLATCEVATRAVLARGDVAARLDVRSGAPLLVMERVNRAPDGAAVHAVRFELRTDRVPVVEHLVNPRGV